MQKKKLSKILFILLAIILLTGCNDTEKKNQSVPAKEDTIVESSAGTEKITIPEEETAGLKKITCTREAEGENNSDVKLNYELYVDGDYIQILHSMEEIITDDQDTLDEYENAYKGIYEHYKDLDYYDTSVIRTDDSVTNDTVINYGKIDTNKLLEIEGEEDNVIKDGKVKLDDWLEFAEQFGTKCDN